jgi:hypothetical protein
MPSFGIQPPSRPLIDHFVMAITSAEAVVRHYAPMTHDQPAERFCFALCDEIDARARAVSKGPIHSRLVGRVLGLRLGMRTWEAQRIAKSWKKHRRHVRRAPLW